jgi:hypothetical protein
LDRPDAGGDLPHVDARVGGRHRRNLSSQIGE